MLNNHSSGPLIHDLLSLLVSPVLHPTHLRPKYVTVRLILRQWDYIIGAYVWIEYE